jgi:hypothetical protein
MWTDPILLGPHLILLLVLAFFVVGQDRTRTVRFQIFINRRKKKLVFKLLQLTSLHTTTSVSSTALSSPNMPEISLTDFVDFAISSGAPKLTKVRTVKNRGAYDPAKDFYRLLRTRIVEFHQRNHPNRNGWFKEFLATLQNERKRDSYTTRIGAYKHFLGRKDVEWFAPVAGTWRSGDLQVRVNPELGLAFNGADHLIKMYFKAETLTKLRVEVILLLMSEALHDQVEPGTQYAILDLTQGRLYASAEPDRNLMPLLHGEAASFAAIWESL